MMIIIMIAGAGAAMYGAGAAMCDATAARQWQRGVAADSLYSLFEPALFKRRR